MNRKHVGRSATPKYQTLMESLSKDIASGRFQPGDKLPSEAALVNRFAVSRITAVRALRELQQRGLIDRVSGSGSYVRNRAHDRHQALIFGLLIPDLGETEIFEPICNGIANAPDAVNQALLWGHADLTRAKDEQAWLLCQQYIARQVAGVFFAPLEFEPHADTTNSRILSALRKASISVVLLDRRPSMNSERDRPDLVGINNRQAGFVATEHLIQLGCRRIAFMGYHGIASTISARMAGYEEALARYGLHTDLASATPASSVEAFVCVNDRVAADLMHGFLAQGVRIPEDVRLVGIDDVRYASLLPVPLTTVRQPTHAIGEAALAVMLERIERPKAPARDVLFDGELIVRKSSGSMGISR